MAHPAGESNDGILRLDFDRRLMYQFRGSVVTSDAGLLVSRTRRRARTVGYGERARTGKNGRHALAGLFRFNGRPTRASLMPYRYFGLGPGGPPGIPGGGMTGVELGCGTGAGFTISGSTPGAGLMTPPLASNLSLRVFMLIDYAALRAPGRPRQILLGKRLVAGRISRSGLGRCADRAQSQQSCKKTITQLSSATSVANSRK
jgi:hypothetical protein